MWSVPTIPSSIRLKSRTSRRGQRSLEDATQGHPAVFWRSRGRHCIGSNMLQLSSVAKTYPGGVHALHDVTLDIPTGLFGLLGPNGAGKSTLMRTIATLQAPDAGTITFDGIDVLRDKTALRRVLGYLPQEFGAYPRTSAEGDAAPLRRAEGSARRGAEGGRRGAARAHQPVGRAQAQRRHVLRRHEAALRHRAGAARQPEAAHRRRTDGGTRSGRAAPVPEPARRGRRGRRRDPVDAPRRRRRRAVPAARDHGRRPDTARRANRGGSATSSRGRLWSCVVPRGAVAGIARAPHSAVLPAEGRAARRCACWRNNHLRT